MSTIKSISHSLIDTPPVTRTIQQPTRVRVLPSRSLFVIIMVASVMVTSIAPAQSPPPVTIKPPTTIESPATIELSDKTTRVDAAPQADEIVAQVNEAIEQLGAREFTQRRQAMRTLRSLGRSAAAAVARAATEYPDPEIRRSAHAIDVDFRFGWFPETPDEIVTAIRDVRSAKPKSQARGIQTLLDAGLENTVLVAIEHRDDPQSRLQFATLVLQMPGGPKRFLTPENLPRLLAAIGAGEPNHANAQTTKLFSPQVVTSIAQAGQLDVLIEFIGTLPAAMRFDGWLRIALNSTAIAKTIADGGADAVFKLIDRGQSPQERAQLASAVLSQPDSLNVLLDSATVAKMVLYLTESES